MLEVYKKITQKYPNYIIGYIDNGLWMQLSVIGKGTHAGIRMRQVELEKTLQYYADQIMEMIKEIQSPNVPAQG